MLSGASAKCAGAWLAAPADISMVLMGWVDLASIADALRVCPSLPSVEPLTPGVKSCVGVHCRCQEVEE